MFLRRADNQPEQSPSEGLTHPIYSGNFINDKNKEDEQALKKIHKKNITMKSSQDRLKLVVYYKNIKKILK